MHERSGRSVENAAALLPIMQETGGGFTDWNGARTAFGSAIATNAALDAEVWRLLGAESGPCWIWTRWTSPRATA